MKLTLERQIPIVFTIAIFLLAVVVFFSFRSMHSLTDAIDWQKHTQEVLLQLDETQLLMINAESGVRAFMITADEKYLEPYTAAKQRINQNIDELKKTVVDHQEQEQRAVDLENTVNQRMNFFANRIELRRSYDLEEVRTKFPPNSTEQELSNKIRELTSEMKTEESKLLAAREASLDKNLISTYRMLYLVGFAGILSLAFANFAIFREVKKRGKAEDKLRNVNKDLEQRVEERTREIQQKNNELEEHIRQREHSENRHRIALEAGNLGTWVFAPHTGLAEMDERSLWLFDITVEDFDGRGKKIFAQIHKEDVREVRKAFRHAFKSNVNLDVRFRYHLRNGKVRWLQCTGQPQFNGQGSPQHFIGHCRDITESKTAENIIRSSELFTRSVLDSLPAHIAVINREGVIVSVNKAWEKFASDNCAKEKLDLTGVGQNYLTVCEKSKSFNVQTELIVKKLYEVLEGRSEDFAVEYPCDSPETKRWFLLQVSALKNGGGAVISHINITDRKLAEIELKNNEEFTRSVFENSPDCVKILELDGTLHSINKNGLCILEIEDFSAYTGKQWVDFWQDEESELAYQAVESARQGETARFEGFCLTAKETPKWWDVSVAPIFDAYGNPTRLISTSRDITERRRSDEERERLLKNEQAARREAEIASRLRDEFLATVSHELRAPLNSILGWARMMEKGTLDEKTTGKAVKTIVRNAESQNRLIEDLLDVSRIISGKMRLEIINIKPIIFVEAALETVRPAAEAKNITLEVIEDSMVSHISGDHNRLQQVMWNLLSNAIKFTPNGGKVTVEINRTKDNVEIKVTDTGIGIPGEFLPHVFDRFRQADASSIRKFGGLGLGLAIVRHITEMHGGNVTVESAGEDQGSTFTVTLPVVSSSADGETTEPVEPGSFSSYESDTKLSLDGLLILIVDDERDTRQLLQQSLTYFGATVITAKSAEEGLKELVDKTPDVLISDIGMPDEDGYSLIKKVRELEDENHRNVTAVALTAYTRAHDRMRALASGYQNYVGKPVEPDELATVIASLKGKL